MANTLESDIQIIERTYGSTVACTLLKALPDSLICCGIALGLYVHWLHYGYVFIFALGICGLFILCTNLALRYYFSVHIFDPLFHIWLMATLCLVGLLDDDFRLTSNQKYLYDLLDVLFVVGSVSHVVVQMFLLICKDKKSIIAAQRGNILKVNDYSRIVGMLVACIAAGSNALILVFIVLAFYANLLAIKLKSILAVFNVLCLCVVTDVYLLPSLNLSISPYAIICALCRLYSKGVLELMIVMPSVTRIERYVNLIMSRRILQRLFVLLYLTVEITFFYFHARDVKRHKEWYVVVPLFVLASIFWAFTRILMLIVMFTLINKFHECKQCLSYQTGSLLLDVVPQFRKILAAKGLRYFSLIAHKLTYAAIFATLLIGALCWITRHPYNHALTSIVLAIQILLCELLTEFTNCLGGTCIGYAIIVPVALYRKDGIVSLLPSDLAQEIYTRSTACVQSVTKFLGQHLIHNFGCDLFTSGMDSSEIRKKLGNFFASMTPEGPHYDTYVLYYSGPVNENGDWAMTGNEFISLSNLLEIWAGSPSMDHVNIKWKDRPRLILICDCDGSDQWLRGLRKLGGRLFVALQTYSLSPAHSRKKRAGLTNDAVESRAVQIDDVIGGRGGGGDDVDLPSSVGDFTRLWVEVNATGCTNRNLFEILSPDLLPRYQVSQNWSNFRFTRPDRQEIMNYWQNYLPRCTHWLIVVTTPSILPDPFIDYFTCAHMFKRWRLKFFPPSELDTGHGFKLLQL